MGTNAVSITWAESPPPTPACPHAESERSWLDWLNGVQWCDVCQVAVQLQLPPD
jgi:hypothetical protein